jgi:heparin binding hemagglutinin HbhA
MNETNERPSEGMVKPLLAVVGAGDLAVAAIAGMLPTIWERARDTGSEVSERARALPTEAQDEIAALREKLAAVRSDVPEEIAELRGRFTAGEVRKVAEEYRTVITDNYDNLVVRGEQTLERLKARVHPSPRAPGEKTPADEPTSALTIADEPAGPPSAPAEKAPADTPSMPAEKAPALTIPEEAPAGVEPNLDPANG